MNATEHKAAMSRKLAAVAGVAVELTIRGPRAFTISTDQRNEAAAEKLAAFFKAGGSVVSVEHDDECGSFVYADV